MFKKKDKVTKILEDIASEISVEEERLKYIENYVNEIGPYSSSEHDLAYHSGRKDALEFFMAHIREFYTNKEGS